MYHFILIFFLIKTQAIIQLGRISNAIWILNSTQPNSTYINISNITCDQCLCQMLEMNNVTISISCQEEWKICQLLFWNATAQLQTNTISIVYFQTIPKFLQATIDSQLTEITTTTTSTTTSSTTFTSSTSTSSSTTSSTSTTTSSSTTTSTTTTTTTKTFFTMNLLVNTGAETGALDPWVASSSSGPSVNNGKGSGGIVTPYNGSYSFYGNKGNGTLYQNVLITNTYSTTELDSGSLVATISFWEISVGTSTSDTAAVNLNFLSTTNTTISTVTTGAKACTSGWCHVTGNWSVPIGTRIIQYVMKFMVTTGSYSDAWIDDNSLIVD